MIGFRTSACLLVTFATATPGICQSPATPAEDTDTVRLGQLLEDHCFSCHGYGSQEGGLAIDELLDAEFLQALQTNDTAYMSAMPSALFREGTSEILNWIVIAGASDRSGHVIDYLPLYRTRTGVGCAMGFAYWELS